MARFSSASPSFGFAACLALLGGLASVCRAEVLEVRSGDAVLGLDGATGATVRLADAGAGLELAGRDQELFRLVVVPPGGDPRQPLELSSRDAKAVSRIEGEGLRLRFEGIGKPEPGGRLRRESRAGGAVPVWHPGGGRSGHVRGTRGLSAAAFGCPAARATAQAMRWFSARRRAASRSARTFGIRGDLPPARSPAVWRRNSGATMARKAAW